MSTAVQQHVVYRQTLVPDNDVIDTVDLAVLREAVMSGFAHCNVPSGELGVQFAAKRTLVPKVALPRPIAAATQIRVQSRLPGDWSGARGIRAAAPAETVALDDWAVGDRVKLRGVFHPRPADDHQVIFRHDAVVDWFHQQCADGGVDLCNTGPSHGELGRGFRDGERVVSVIFRRIGSTGVVTDVEKFASLLGEGVGPSREFGAGMVLTTRKVAP